jgi:hypothetical protein
MRQYAVAVLAGLSIVLLSGAPSFAVTAKDKAAICKFGADNQKLKGAQRAAFIKKCMSDQDDPRGPATPDEPQR